MVIYTFLECYDLFEEENLSYIATVTQGVVPVASPQL
jgi:hypothetical protein